ncbi:MAG: hypothetical protein ABR606_18640 [Vicinamibacterales bacterium]
MPRRLSAAPAVLGVLAAAWLAWLLALPEGHSTWPLVLAGWALLAAASHLAARRSACTWLSFVQANADTLAVAAVLVYAVGVQLADSHGITSDGAIYFSQLRSLIFDGDFDIGREFAVLGQPARPHHVVPIGPTLLWLPLYCVTAGIDAVGQLVGAWSAPADGATRGLGLPYVRAASVSSFAAGAAGLMALHLRLRREFTPGAALATTLLIFGATSLCWYMVYEPSMTHAASFGAVVAFVLLVERWVPRDPTAPQAIVLGTLAGVAFVTRPQDALFAIYPAVIVASTSVPIPERVRRARRLTGWAIVGAVPWLLAQAIQTSALLSIYPFTLAGEGGYLHLLGSRWVDVLFSSWHGFLSWTPVAYVAVLGTIAYLRRAWRWAAAALIILALMAWINGAAEDWAAGWSFGGRRFTSTLAMLAPGLALLVDAVRRRPLLALAPLVVGALWWNYLLMVQYTVGMLPKDEPVAFGRLVRQQVELHTRSPYVYPFAFPANVWFARRTGLPAERYDLLASEPLRSELDLPFDARVERFLLQGWEAPGGDDWGSSWWIGGTPAVLAVPLDLPTDRPVDIEVRARTRYEEPVVEAQLALDVNGHEVGDFTAGAREPTLARLTVAPERFRTVWRAGYNHLALRSLGVRRVDPTDARPPGPLARQSERRPWPVSIYSLRITAR